MYQENCPGRRDVITSREREVLQWIKEGKSTWDISHILGISERTVKFHVGNIKKKLDATNRSHAVAIATELGIFGSAATGEMVERTWDVSIAIERGIFDIE